MEDCTLMLIGQLIVFVILFIRLVRKDIVVAFYFSTLFIYGFPAEIGYLYAPQLSASIFAYFGPSEWYRYWMFITGSLVGFFFFSNMWLRLFNRIAFGKIQDSFDGTKWLARIFIVVAIIIQGVVFAVYSDQVGWATVASEDYVRTNPLLSVAIFFFKVSTGYNIVLYSLWRRKSTNNSRSFMGLFVISFGVFVVVAQLMGNRTDLIAFAIGVLARELIAAKLTIATLLKYSLIAIAAYFAIDAIRMGRDINSAVNDLTTFEKLLKNDYYSPAHILFSAISLDYIMPKEVVISNLANSIIYMKVPYLQFNLTEIINPGVTTRSASYAYYIFSEGAMFAGEYIGVLYNGLLISFWIVFWRLFSRTNDSEFNILISALMASMVINLTRGQSAYFIKYFYTYIIPNLFIYLSLSEKSWKFVIYSSPKSLQLDSDAAE